LNDGFVMRRIKKAMLFTCVFDHLDRWRITGVVQECQRLCARGLALLNDGFVMRRIKKAKLFTCV